MAGDVNRNANVNFNIRGADQSRQDIEKIRSSVDGLGSDYAGSAQRIVDAANGVQVAVDKISAKEENHRVVTQRDGALVIQEYNRMRQAIEQTFGSMEQAPAEVQEAFRKATAQFEQATAKIRETTTVVHQQRDEMSQAGAEWTSLGGAINQVLGPQGRFVAQAGLVLAAFREGIQLGTQFAQAIGTNFQAAEEAANGLKESVRGLTNALVTDGLWAAIQQGRAVLKNLDDSITGSGKAIQGYNALVSIGIDRQEALKVSTEDLRVVADAYRLAQEGGAAGLRLFNETVRQSDHSQLAKSLDDLKGRFQQLALQEGEAVAKQHAHKEAIGDTIGAIEAEIKKMEAEREARRLGLEQLEADIQERSNYKKAIEDNARAAELGTNVISEHLTPSMRSELEELQRLSQNYEQNKAAIERMAAALRSDAQQHADYIAPEYRKHIQEIVDLIEKYGQVPEATQGAIQWKIQDAISEADAAAKTRAHTEIVRDADGVYRNHAETVGDVKVKTDGLKTTITNVTEETRKSTVEFDKSTRTMANVKEAAERLGDRGGTFSVMGGQVHDATTEAKRLNDILDELAQKAEERATKILHLAEAIRQLGAASTEATGSETSQTPSAQHGPNTPGERFMERHQ